MTTKGAGLNPNAKVWQEVSAPTTHAPEAATETCHWPQGETVSTEESEGMYIDWQCFSAARNCSPGNENCQPLFFVLCGKQKDFFS